MKVYYSKERCVSKILVRSQVVPGNQRSGGFFKKKKPNRRLRRQGARTLVKKNKRK